MNIAYELVAFSQEGLVNWFREFLRWLLTSKHGQEEAKAKNNHSTQYDAQLLSYALFVGDVELAKKVAESAKRRIDSQIEADGKQPQELSRETSWDYSCENLRNFARVAQLSRHVDVDLWSYSHKGRSLLRAVEYLLPFVSTPWPHTQIHDFQPWRLKSALLLAPKDLGYDAVAFRMIPRDQPERLLYASPKAE